LQNFILDEYQVVFSLVDSSISDIQGHGEYWKVLAGTQAMVRKEITEHYIYFEAFKSKFPQTITRFENDEYISENLKSEFPPLIE
jgi:hypothetical protein